MKWYEYLWAFLKRKCWYIVLLLCSSIYVFHYRYEVYQLKDFNAQNLIFTLWLVLLLMPLFSEMEFFGVKLKKEVEKAKSEVKDDLKELRMQILDLKITNSQSVAFNVALPTKHEVEETIRSVEESRVDGDETGRSEEDFVSDESVYLFKVRLTLEKILSNFCDHMNYTGPKSLNQMTDYVLVRNIVDKQTADYIRQIVAVCNRGIHGEIVSPEYIDLVKTIMPQVLERINSVTIRLGYKYYFVCPRCRFSGYAEYENACPKCGHTSGE